MDSVDKQKRQIIELLSKTIPDNEKVLDFTADLMLRNEGDDVYKKWVALCFYIAYIDNEVKYMLNATLTDQKAFVYLHKYTALVMHEAIETLPKLYNDFIKTLNEAEKNDGRNRFDRQKLNDGYRAYKAAIKSMKEDGGFMQTITGVRNNVAAHHQDLQGSVKPLVDWYVSKRKEMDEKENPEVSTFIVYASEVARALYPLAQSLLSAISN